MTMRISVVFLGLCGAAGLALRGNRERKEWL